MFRPSPHGIEPSNWHRAESARIIAETIMEANSIKKYTPRSDEVEVYSMKFSDKIENKCYAYTLNNYRVGDPTKLSRYYDIKEHNDPSDPYRYFSKSTDLHYAGEYRRSERGGSYGKFGKDIFFRDGKEIEIESSNNLCYKEVPCESPAGVKGGKRRRTSKRTRRNRRKTSRKY